MDEILKLLTSLTIIILLEQNIWKILPKDVERFFLDFVSITTFSTKYCVKRTVKNGVDMRGKKPSYPLFMQ